MRRLAITVLRDQRIRFLIVGGINTLVGYLVYAALTVWVFPDVRFGYLISLALSYVVAIGLAFVLYRRFVFRVHGNVLQDLLRFVTVYLVAITINAIALPLLVEVLSVPPLLAQLIVLVGTTLLSFFGHRSFSFGRPAGTAATGATGATGVPDPSA
ncbi:GtrA family protein [Planctomonas psychrotolerans]|uniref:GtrA family protein n=1 Tax=Planctomonas psychrotolerans TaxID=2528712 RepID=UPI00123B5BDF|nr:GtrA family protein [Planctomonas psychrotolerans]